MLDVHTNKRKKVEIKVQAMAMRNDISYGHSKMKFSENPKWHHWNCPEIRIRKFPKLVG